MKPPKIDNDANRVCGINRPKTIVAPMYGAVSNHILAQTVVENEQIFRFSNGTNSIVHDASMAKVEDMAALDIIAISISKALRGIPVTVYANI